jgi:hypothetical protein
MNRVLHILILVIGGAISYPLALQLNRYGLLTKFAATAGYTLAFAYLLAWISLRSLPDDLRRLTKEGLLKLKREEPVIESAWRRNGGHILLVLSALVIAYGFSVKNVVALIGGAIAWWVADDLLTKAWRRRHIADTPLPLINKLPPHDSFDSLISSIPELQKNDPLIVVKVVALEVYFRIHTALKKKKTVDPVGVPLLYAIGALAGYSCQVHVRHEVSAQGLPADSAFIEVKTSDGKRLFYGDPINNLLIKEDLCLWSLARLAAEYRGGTAHPDLNELFAHVSATAGAPEFGIPRILPHVKSNGTPFGYLRELWPTIQPVLEKYLPDPRAWPVVLNVAAQTAIEASEKKVKPDAALLLLMESAIAMSKVDLNPV